MEGVWECGGVVRYSWLARGVALLSWNACGYIQGRSLHLVFCEGDKMMEVGERLLADMR